MKATGFFLLLMTVLFTLTPSKAATNHDYASQLDSPDSAVRLETLRQIALDHTFESLSLLVKAADDEDEDVRERAIQGLGLSGRVQAVEPVKKALKDLDEFVRWRAVQALGRLGALNVVEEVARLVNDNSWRVKVSVCELLGDISIKLLQQSSVELSRTPAKKRIRQVLMQALTDKDERVRLSAGSALARNKDSAALGPLLDLLQNGSMLARCAAGAALGDLGDPRAIKPLLEAISDSRNREEPDGSDFARWGPVKGLVKITGRDFACDIAIDAAATEQEGFERKRALNSLKQLKEKDMAGDPSGLLKNKNGQVKLKVFELSGTIDGKILEPYLRQGLEDPDPRVRKAAKATLAGK